jgi:hypothetical protein
LKTEKDGRKRRRLLDRGFKPLPPADEGDEEEPKDPEIEEDPEDFEKGEHEKDVMKGVLASSGALVIDGNWRDVNEEVVTLGLEEILVESRRVPEIVIHLVCSAENTAGRMINEEKIKVEYEKQLKQLEEEIAKERAEARTAKEEEL